MSSAYIVETIVEEQRGNDEEQEQQQQQQQQRNINKVMALFHGNYQSISRLPATFQSSTTNNNEQQQQDFKPSGGSIIRNIRMIPFNHYSEQHELIEFRLLNHKNRCIVRPVENGSSILIGFDPERKQFITFDTNGTLVLRGPITLLEPPAPPPSATSGEESSSGKHQHQPRLMVNHSGHLTLIIIGQAMIDLNPTMSMSTQIHLLPGEKNRFVLDPRTIPFRFQQKAIVQRQREMLQQNNNNCNNQNHQNSTSSTSLMSLETFDHLLY